VLLEDVNCSHCQHVRAHIDSEVERLSDHMRWIQSVYWVAMVAAPNVPGSEAHAVPHVGWDTPEDRQYWRGRYHSEEDPIRKAAIARRWGFIISE